MKKPIIDTKKVIANIPKPSFDNFKGFNEKFSIIYDFVVRLTIILAFITFINYSLREITSNKYILTNIDVSESIEKDGNLYSSDLKQQIIIDMKRIIGNAKNATHSSSNVANSVSNDAIALSFGGFDLNQVFLIFRKFFHLQNREVRAYVMESGSSDRKYKVLLSVGNEPQTESEFQSKENLSAFLAENILKYNAPHKLGLYQINEKNDTTAANETIEYLDYLKEKESWWEKLFQDNNWEIKKLHLEAMKSYSKKDYALAKSIYKEILNEENYSDILLEIAQTYNQLNSVSREQINYLQNVKLDQVDSSCNVYESNRAKIDSLNKTIKDNKIEIKKYCYAFKSNGKGTFIEDNEERKLQKNNLESRVLLILAEVEEDYNESENALTGAIEKLSKDDIESNAHLYNWAANIKLSHLKIGNVKREDILKKAEDFIKIAINLKPKDGNYHDTYAEIFLANNEMQGFYQQIEIALKYPDKAKKITKQDYEKFERWPHLKDDKKFKYILNNAKSI